MVLMLDGNSEYVAHALRKKGVSEEINSKCDCSRSNQMPWTNEITEIAHLFLGSHLI